MFGSYSTGAKPGCRPSSRHGAREGAERGRAFYGGRGDWGGFGPGHRGPRGRGRKARRGDIRTAALLLLKEEPRNGYQLMQEVEARSEGTWSPSPGSVYPALSQLEDEGLIRSEEQEGRRVFVLTDAGAAVLAERPEDRPAPWEEMSDAVSGGMHELGRLMREVAFAFAQVMKTGSESQVASAREVLVRTRKDLYLILADGDEDADTVKDDA